MSTLLDRLRARLDRKAAARRRGAGGTARTAGAPEMLPEPPSQTPSPAASETALPPAEPRVVRRIVWGYAVGVLPVPWLMGYKRLKALLERERLAIRVDLLPLTSLPDEVDLLFVPDELAEDAGAAAPAARVIALGGRPQHAVFQSLVEQLRAGTELRPPPSAPPEQAADDVAAEQSRPRGTIVRYQGWQRID